MTKYGSRKVIYNGRVYHSAAEAAHAQELDALVRAKRILRWTPQIRIAVLWPDAEKLVCTVVIDFIVHPCDGPPYYEEVKGAQTPVYRLKRKLLALAYPELDYRVLHVVGSRLVPESEFLANQKATAKTKRIMRKNLRLK